MLCAVIEGHCELVEYFASLKADLTLSSSRGRPERKGYQPLHWAIVKGRHQVMQILLNHSVNVEQRVTKMAYHPLHLAAQYNDVVALGLLLNAFPLALEVEDAYKQSPLLWAAALSDPDIFLLKISLQAQ